MDKLANEYMESFNEKLKDFFDVHSKWWILNKSFNSSGEIYSTDELCFWFYMQQYARNRVNNFADTLPADAKAHIEPRFKIINEQLGMHNNPDKV